MSLLRCVSFSVVVLAVHPAYSQVTAKPDHVGDALQIVLPLAAAGLTLQQHDLEGFEQLALTAAISQGTTDVLKRAVNARRPDGTGKGFPSGHASIAFASAAFVQQRYGLAWAVPMYGLATLTAYERVATHHHYTKDVVGGGLIGVGSAFLVTHPIDRNTRAMLGVPVEGRGIEIRIASTW